MDLNDVKIISNQIDEAEIYIDGVLVQGLQSYELEHSIDRTPIITMTFIPGTINKTK
jgi:hypothetical protein